MTPTARSSSPGQGLELYLARYHEHLRQRGEALVAKIPTPVQIRSRRGGAITGVLQPPVWVDYAGVIAPSGRAVAIEAKVRPDRITMSDLEPHQRSTLAAVDAVGGVAIVYVRLTSSDLIVPWGEFVLRTSIRRDDGPWVRPPGRGWFAAAAAWASYEGLGWEGVP